MSKQHVNEFRALMAADPALAEQVREVTCSRPYAAGGGVPGMIVLARARGFEFTEAEVDEILTAGELSELELDLVAGGVHSDGNPS